MFPLKIKDSSKLNLTALESIQPISWSQAFTYSEWTECAIVDQKDREKFIAIFPDASDYTFYDRSVAEQYVFWKMQQATQTPDTMSLDVAYAEGATVIYKPEKAIIQGPQEKIVPACRVPMAEEKLRQTADKRGVREGSDVLAASLASMTRWTGREVVLCMPVDTLDKYKFRHAKPSGLKKFLFMVPGGEKGHGLKGRAWAYYLMATLQNMEAGKYMEFRSNWVQSIFCLPEPSPSQRIPTVFENNVSYVAYKDKLYYRIEYKNPGLLGSFENAYVTPESYEQMASILVDFASSRQGDNAGISMLSQSASSWGLVSKSQSELEQTISLVLGMADEKTVLAGYSQPELERIRASVARHDKKIRVWEKVDTHDIRNPQTQTSDHTNGLFIIRGRTMLDTTISATRQGKVKSYHPDAALEKMWLHVERALSLGDHVVFLAAALPPKQTKIHTFQAANTWASVFFFSLKPKIIKALYDHEKGIAKKECDPIAVDTIWPNIIKGMNNTVATWIVPPVNRFVTFSGLLVSVKSVKKQMVAYDPASDNFLVEYVEDEESDDEEGDKQEASLVKKKPPKAEAPAVAPTGTPPPSNFFVPTIVASAEDI